LFTIHIDILDYALAIFYLIVILIIAIYYQTIKVDNHKEYVYFTPGLFVKILGGLVFTFIYMFYYKGGDTISYFYSAKVLTNLFLKSPHAYFSILLGHLTPENWSYFDSDTGYPVYYRDKWAFTVVRFTSILVFFGAKSFLSTVILISSISYISMWKLFRFLYKEFPLLKTEFAIAILFFPSVVFWGSGILKDTYTLAVSAFTFLSFYAIIIYKRKILLNLFLLSIFGYFILTIKPYVFFIQFATFLIVFIYVHLKRIKSVFLKFLVFPFISISILFVGVILFSSFGKMSGGFYISFNDILENAFIKQKDLTQPYYGENSFNIGYFEPTVQGVLSKFLPAVNAGFFRPYLWEASNIVMLLSGLETLIILLFSIWIVIHLIKILFFRGVRWIIHFFFSHPFIVYALFFSISFSFVIGLTSANFGALVRYKIPFLQYFMSLLFILNYYIKKANIV